jgi:hypothetical protein
VCVAPPGAVAVTVTSHFVTGRPNSLTSALSRIGSPTRLTPGSTDGFMRKFEPAPMAMPYITVSPAPSVHFPGVKPKDSFSPSSSLPAPVMTRVGSFIHTAAAGTPGPRQSLPSWATTTLHVPA